MKKINFLIIFFVLHCSFSFAENSKAYFGGGCFWCMEEAFEKKNGVKEVISGYSGGTTENPTYEDVVTGETGHAEVVEILFDPNIVSYEELLEVFWRNIDPTALNYQFADVGSQYRTEIFTVGENQMQLAEASKKELGDSGKFDKPIVTAISAAPTFYIAEEYHQDYIKKNPNGYCPDHSTGVAFNKIETPTIDNSFLLSGKYVLVIDSQDYCPYCENFKKDVANDYQGSIPMVYRTAIELNGLDIQTPTWATPTIVFLENGSELFSYQGYMEPELFYKALGKFKLGDTEAYDVAFNQGTDARFCKEYQIFKNTPDGIFVDKLSGAPLFDTRDRFVSRSGWLSFTAPVPNSTYELPDNSYGMKRTEVKSKSSNIHLGHVFDDGPNGMPRYCINATVLEFIAREDIKNS